MAYIDSGNFNTNVTKLPRTFLGKALKAQLDFNTAVAAPVGQIAGTIVGGVVGGPGGAAAGAALGKGLGSLSSKLSGAVSESSWHRTSPNKAYDGISQGLQMGADTLSSVVGSGIGGGMGATSPQGMNITNQIGNDATANNTTVKLPQMGTNQFNYNNESTMGAQQFMAAYGGNIPQVQMYNGGGTHEQNPYGGIPVDSYGNPSMNPSALVEQNEVGYKLPNDESGYVFSDRINYPGKKSSFSSEAKRIMGKYKNRMGSDLSKPDALAKQSLDKEIEELKNKQELMKQVEQEKAAVKAYGGYLKKLAMGDPIVKNKSIPAAVANFTNRLTGDVSDTTMYSPQAVNFPTWDVSKDARTAMPGVFQGTGEAIRTIGAGQKASVPIRKEGNSWVTQDYTTDKDVVAQTLNDRRAKNAAELDAYQWQLRQFLNPEFLTAGKYSMDSLANVQGGDTTGTAAILDKIAKGHPKRGSVDPAIVFNKENADRYINTIVPENQRLKGTGAVKNASNVVDLSAVRGTNEASPQADNLGKALFGLRSALTSSPHAYKEFVDVVNPTTTSGTAIPSVNVGLNEAVQPSYRMNYTNPIVYDPKTKQYTSYVADKAVANYAPYNSTGDAGSDAWKDMRINPNTFERGDTNTMPNGNSAVGWGVVTGGSPIQSGPIATPKTSVWQKAYGGGLPTYEIKGQLPTAAQSRDNFLKGSGLKEAYAGYGIQALGRLPQLLTKAENISYDRVSPETINLAQERANMETSRNNQLGFLKRQASMAGSAGQALNYLGSVVPSAYNQYDQQYAQSIEREQNANTQIRNQANAQNAQIQMREAEANAMERDAARGIRDQAFADIGNIGMKAMMAKPEAIKQYNDMMVYGQNKDYGIYWDEKGAPHLYYRGEKDSKPTLPFDNSRNYSNKPQIESRLDGIGKEISITGEMPNYKWNTILTDIKDLYGKEFACGGKLCKGGYIKKKGKK
jgi:hypothetical protein